MDIVEQRGEAVRAEAMKQADGFHGGFGRIGPMAQSVDQQQCGAFGAARAAQGIAAHLLTRLRHRHGPGAWDSDRLAVRLALHEAAEDGRAEAGPGRDVDLMRQPDDGAEPFSGHSLRMACSLFPTRSAIDPMSLPAIFSSHALARKRLSRALL